jgi:hypothetical protein
VLRGPIGLVDGAVLEREGARPKHFRDVCGNVGPRSRPRSDSRLTALSVRASELRDQLWADPGAASEVEERLVADEGQGGLENWIESLPFPLASIAYRYVADDALDAKIERLLHLFEATAEFGATLLLSAVHADTSLYEREREACFQISSFDTPGSLRERPVS